MVTASVMISLFTIILLQRFTKILIISMISGFMVFALFNRQIFFHMIKLLGASLSDGSFLTLIPSIFLIYFLGELMSVSRDSDGFSQSVQKLFEGSRGASVFIPAIVGLMPMPAGAMFTAPMIDQIGSDMSKLEKTTVNYWFRHCLEFFWPVYPAMYLLASLINMPIGVVSLRLFPLFLVAFLSGWVFFNGFNFPKLKNLELSEWKKLWPIAVILSTGLMILLFKLEGWVALTIATVFYASIRNKYILEAFKRAVRKLDIIFILIIVFLYKHSMIDLQIGQKMSEELSKIGFNVLLIAILLPLITGMSTGLTHAALGISLPIVMSMGGYRLGLVTYVFSVTGVLLSPVHLCLVLTANYFKVDFIKVLGKILIPILIISVITVVFYP
ncbi:MULTISPECIES: DUF401 family protein [Pseudothermotoga]|uniref:DUF401 family protein n=1 Tax=Pseudothermotoga lettingae (strain ATCC BAA-301 / DSM 14385 / NBRC 107922 / TMO) TaxID=416591 RepID=A8F4P1_PSELT|nr:MULTISPECIES: DUF401 family protein [Pseudothermotoga]ABV33125.1 protein of unknown function DUF401 [Pseudothermotoga lettingae TMO]KUK21054.1 MAG: Uncharacterized protein XD56_1023 [Pseudothermotoga lettingae]MDI3494392.1 uncharacterized protein [Pseudothermotoga sp.]GLI47873.1 hypothetical protein PLETTINGATMO_00420 [Pseudothermotoga lettingae TMO]HBJ82168.1 DUF401 domain-containing protein [Pseudothermotoga sp.]